MKRTLSFLSKKVKRSEPLRRGGKIYNWCTANLIYSTK